MRPDQIPGEKTGAPQKGRGPVFTASRAAHAADEFFAETHMVSLMLYIRDHPGCRKSDIYRDVVRNDRVPDKLEMMKAWGIMTSDDRGNNREVMRLTPEGERIADLLAMIDLLMSRTRPRDSDDRRRRAPSIRGRGCPRPSGTA